MIECFNIRMHLSYLQLSSYVQLYYFCLLFSFVFSLFLSKNMQLVKRIINTTHFFTEHKYVNLFDNKKEKNILNRVPQQDI